MGGLPDAATLERKATATEAEPKTKSAKAKVRTAGFNRTGPRAVLFVGSAVFNRTLKISQLVMADL
jgi:hypothetical protein